jgi:hypothetical protein
VKEMQMFLTRLRRYEPRGLGLLAIAEAIRYEFELAAVPSPLPPIDYDAAQLGRVRAQSKAMLRQVLKREPRVDELAVEVVREYRGGEPAVEAALRKMRRLIREAQRYEYATLASHTGRGELPSPR